MWPLSHILLLWPFNNIKSILDSQILQKQTMGQVGACLFVPTFYQYTPYFLGCENSMYVWWKITRKWQGPWRSRCCPCHGEKKPGISQLPGSCAEKGFSFPLEILSGISRFQLLREKSWKEMTPQGSRKPARQKLSLYLADLSQPFSSRLSWS